MPLRFGLVIYWSPEDQAFLVEVPELPGCKANGQSYEEAVANARVVIEEWIQKAQELGRPIPEPQGKLILGTTAEIARCHPGSSWIARCLSGHFRRFCLTLLSDRDWKIKPAAKLFCSLLGWTMRIKENKQGKSVSLGREDFR
jgi:predicted RNase H-like HicB family nuclease